MRKLKFFLSLLMLFCFSVGTVFADDYVKVTSAPTDWSGDYLIVYEGDATHDTVAFNGGLTTIDANSNKISVTIKDGKIAANSTTNAAKFTIATMTGGYSIKAANGKYIGATSYANSLVASESAIANSLSLDASGNAVIGVTIGTSGTVTLRYNYANNTWRFRYYKSGQQAIKLYKLTASASPSVSVTKKDGSAIPAAGIDFGSHDKNQTNPAAGNAKYFTDTLIVKGSNLTANVNLQTGSSIFTVEPTQIKTTDWDANGEAKIAVRAWTDVDADTHNGTLTIYSAASTPEFTKVDIALTHKVLGPSITFVDNNSNPLTTMAFGNVGKRFQKSFVYGIQYKKLEAGNLSFEITGTDADAFAFYSSSDQTINISSAGNGSLSYLSFHQATETVGDYSATLKVTGCGLPTAGITIPITMSVKAPEITTSVSSIDFGDLKQDEQGVLSAPKTFTLTGKYLKNGIALNCYGNLFDAGDEDGYTVINPDDDGNINATIKVRAALGWSGTNNSYLIVKGTGASPEFEDIEDLVTIKSKIIAAYPVSFQVYDNDRGTITINGKASDEYGRVKVYVVDGTEEISAVATPKLGYAFAEWQVANADKDKVTIDDKTSANATVQVSSQPEDLIWAMFIFDCTPLAKPSDFACLNTTYNSADLKWQCVWEGENKAKTYHIRAIPVDDPEFPIEKNVTLTDEQVAESNVYYTFTGLDGNTEYDFEIWGTSKAEGYCSTGKVAGVSSVITTDYPAATLTLSENGVERTYEGTHKLGAMVPLPSEVVTGIVGKEFMGWSASSSCTTAPEYNKGQQYKLSAVSNKLYAVYATATPGTPTSHDLFAATSLGSTNTVTSGYTVSAVAGAKNGYYQDDGNVDDKRYVQVMVSNTETQIISTQPSAIKVTATIGGGSVKNPLGGSVYAVLLDADGNEMGASVELTDKVEATTGKAYTASLPINSYADVRGVRIYHVKESGYNVRYFAISMVYETGGEMSYSAYTTTGPRLLALPTFTPAEGTYTEAKNIAISAAEGTIYYNVDSDSDPTSASTAYSSAIALNTYGEHVIKAIAIDGDNKSNVATATYFMNLPFTSLEALVAAELESGTENVTVSFSDVEITDINNSNRSVYLNVKDKDGVNDIQLFNYNALEESWAVGGALSGTITCTWTLFNSKWELIISSWTTGITYAKPAPTLAWSASSATVKKGATDNVFPTLTNPDALSVSYSSTDETVATIASNGAISLLKAGTTTIKASFAGNDDYRAVVVSYTLTVQKAAEGVLKLYNNGVVDFGNVRVGTSSVGSEVLRVDGSKLTPNSELEVSIDGTDGYFEVQVPSDGKIDVDENGVIDYYAINIVPTSAALAQRGDISATLRLHSDDLAADSLATIKMHVGAVITITPAEPDLAFGEVLKGDDESKYTKTIHLNVTNMDPNCQVLINPYAGFKVDGNYYRTPNAQGVIDVDITFTPNTSSSVGVISGPLQFFSAGSPSQFSSPMVVATMSMTMIASTAITVPDISNGSLSWDGGAAPVVAKPGSEHTLLAVPASGYTGGEIAILKAEDDSDVTDEVLSGSTLTVPSYAIKVVVSGFEAQAHPSGLGWRYGDEDVTTHAHTYGASTERFYFPSLKNPNEIDLDDIEFISSDSTVAEFGARSHEYSSWFASVWVKKAGTAVMTARLKNHATYDDIEVSYTLTVSKGELAANQFRWVQYPDIYEPESDTYTWYESHSWPYINASSTYVDKANEVTYESTNTDVATISSTGTITPVAVGSTVIKANFIGNDMFNAKSVQFTLNVQKASPVLSWSFEPTTANTTVDLKNSFSLISFPYFGSVSPNVEALRDLVVISSSNPAVAEINSNGYVNPLAEGTTTIKLSLAATDKSNAAEELSYTFTVTDSRPVLTIVAGDHGTYEVRDNSNTYTIENGAKVKANTNLYLRSLSAETGYKNTPVYKVVKTSDNTVITSTALNGSYLRMQSYDMTISATYPEKAVAPIGWSSTETQYAYTDDRAYTLPTLVNAGLPVTFASSNTNVATISYDGSVSVWSAGTTNISVSYAGDGNYKQTTVSYELHVCSPSAIYVSGGTLTHDYFENGDELTDFSGMTANLSYTNGASSVDITDVATWTATPSTIYSETEDIPAVDVQIKATYKGITGTYPNNVRCYLYTHAISYSEPAHGTIVVKKGTQEHSSWRKYLKGTVLTVEATPDADYKLATLTANGVDIMSTKQFTIGTEDVTIVATFDMKLDAEIGWSSTADVEVYMDHSNTYTLPTVVNPHNLAVTFRSSNTNVATIDDNGVITIQPGADLSTLIQVKYAGDNDYKPATVSFTLKAYAPDHILISEWSSHQVSYDYGDEFNFNGYKATMYYTNNGHSRVITDEATWTTEPATITADGNITVKATYAGVTGTTTANVEVKTYIVSINSQITHGAVVVKHNGVEINSGDRFVKGTELTVEVVPESGYELKKLSVMNTQTAISTEISEGTFIVGTEHISFNATFQPTEPTALDEAEAEHQVRKVLIDDKLFIIRGDKMFDAQGKLVK